MLSEALAALATAGGAPVVQAAGTDAWTGVRNLERLQGAERDAAIAELRALIEGSTAQKRHGGGSFTGNVIHGPTAVQTGSSNRQDNHFGHSA
jgi:hypothetical protein